MIPPMTRPPRDLPAGIAVQVQVIRGLDWIKTTRTMYLQIVTVSFLLLLVLLLLAVRTPHADYYADIMHCVCFGMYVNNLGVC